MMGCLKRIFSLIILVLAFIGFQSIGGIDFCKEKINDFLHPKRSTVIKESMSIANFSKMPTDYQLMRTLNFMGVKLAFAKHTISNQKLMFIDTKGTIDIKKDDFYSNKIDKNISTLAKKFAYQAIRLEEVNILSSGVFQGLDQEIPYIIFKSNVVGLQEKKMYGMLGVAEAPDGENDILLSFSLDKRYSQTIAENLFRSISYLR